MNGVSGHFYALSRAELSWGQPGLMRSSSLVGMISNAAYVDI